jgi:MFS family permease
MRLRRPTASEIVLGLLCLMYLITYMDRVNASTAANAIKQDLPSSYLQLGFVISAWAYPYIVFQILGGWIGDRFGPRSTLFLCGLVWAIATILTGFAGSLTTLFLARLMLGVGEGATFPVATRAMQAWTPQANRGFAQGVTHAFARFGNFVTPPIVAWLIALVTWRGSFIATGVASLIWVLAWLWYFRDVPATHSAITAAELDRLPNHGQPLVASGTRVQIPWAALARRMAPVTVVYFCYGWILWMYLNWLPTYFQQMFKLNLSRSAIFSSAVFAGGVLGDYLGGVISDAILKRTGDRRKARCHFVVVAFSLSFLSLLPMFVARDLNLVVISLAAAFFFAELVIGPMWAIPMDIAPRYSGTASGFMNTGSAVAAVVSPTLFGFLIDRTGNWNLPFIGSLALLLLGAVLAFAMHPEKPFEEIETVRMAGSPHPVRQSRPA